MKSRWQHLRPAAEQMRLNGASIKTIRNELGIPLSTLSGWLKSVEITKDQREALDRKSKQNLKDAQAKAVLWHRKDKINRNIATHQAAMAKLNMLDEKDPLILILALSFLYLGEGGKTEHGLSLGNSDPGILLFYLHSLETIYGVKRTSLHYALHLRADQDSRREKEFWSSTLAVTEERFGYVIKDPRTLGKPTRPGYHGVCLITGGTVAIQRELMYLAKEFVERTCAISSFG